MICKASHSSASFKSPRPTQQCCHRQPKSTSMQHMIQRKTCSGQHLLADSEYQPATKLPSCPPRGLQLSHAHACSNSLGTISPFEQQAAQQTSSTVDPGHKAQTVQHSMPLAGQPISAPPVINTQEDSMQETVLAAEVAAHCGYQFVRQLPDQAMFGSSRALQVRCSRTNRLRTLLQVPRSQLQHLDRPQQQQLVQEVQLASSLHHPHMLQVQEVFVGPLHLNIVLEECSAGRLLDYPAKQQAAGMSAAAEGPAQSTASETAEAAAAALSPEFARWFFQQVVLAVDYCHAKGVTGLAIEHTLLKVVPNLPQPIVKVPTQLLAQGLASLLPPEQQAPGSTSTTSSSRDFLPPESSAPSSKHTTDHTKADVWACGVLLLTLLGGQLQHFQPQQWDQVSPGLGSLLQQLLHPDPAHRCSVGQVLRDPWCSQALPPAAADMTTRFLAKGRVCRQPVGDMEALLEMACSTSTLVLQQQVAHAQQQQQLVHAVQAAQQQGQGGVVSSDTLARLLQQLHALQAAVHQLAVASRAGHSAAAVVLLPFSQLLQQMISRIRAALPAAARAVHPRQQQAVSSRTATLLRLLQQVCSDVLFRVNMFLDASARHSHLQQQEPTALAHVLLGWSVVPTLWAGTAAANALWNSSSRSSVLQGMQLPPLPATALAVQAASRGLRRAAHQQLMGAVLLPTLNQQHCQPTTGSGVGTHVLAQLVLQCAAVTAAQQQQSLLQEQQQGASLLLHGDAQELFAEVQFAPQQQQQQEISRGCDGCITFEANSGSQAVQVVGLAALFPPTHSRPENGAKVGSQGSETAADAYDSSLASATKQQPLQPDLSLVGEAGSPAAVRQLADTLQQLQAAQQGVPVGSMGGSNSSSSSSKQAAALTPVYRMCLDPPLLVLPKPAAGTLEQWISSRVGAIDAARDAAAASGDFTAAWAAGVPWDYVMQLLRDVAAGLSTLHQQQPAVVHGGVHAAAVHLLQKSDAPYQQQQEGQRVSQLSLAGLLSRLAPLPFCHPFLAAPETLLASGPASPAADVYGFGVLMFQLATGWLPQQYAAGTDEQIAAVMWCREMMVQAGSTSPLAAAQALAQHKARGTVSCFTGCWTPYGRHLLSDAARQQLPVGYHALMEQCLSRMPAARPRVQQLAGMLAEIASGIVDINSCVTTSPGGACGLPGALPAAVPAVAPLAAPVEGAVAGPAGQDAPCSPVSSAAASRAGSCFRGVESISVILLQDDEGWVGVDDEGRKSAGHGQLSPFAQHLKVQDPGSWAQWHPVSFGAEQEVQHGSDRDIQALSSGCSSSIGVGRTVWRQVVSVGTALCPKKMAGSCSCSSMRWLKSQVHRARAWVASRLEQQWPEDGWVGLASCGSLPVHAHGGLVSPMGTAVAAGVVLMASVCSAGAAGPLPAGVFSCPLA